MGITALAWAAGFVDGEGCISITVRKPRRAQRTPQYTAQLGVFNLDPAPLVKLHQMFGGTIYFRSRVSHLRAVGEWRIKGKNAAWALEQLRPFLIVKREQAALAIHLHAIKRITGRAGLPIGLLQEFARIREQVTTLKHQPYDLSAFAVSNVVN